MFFRNFFFQVDLCKESPSMNSLQTYILYKVLQDIQESQIKRLFEKSNWAKYPRPYWVYICAILQWLCAFALDENPAFDIPEGDSRNVLSESLAMLLCIFIQTYQDERSSTPSDHALKASNCAGLISTLMSRAKFKKPFVIIALFGALFERFGRFGNDYQLQEESLRSVCVHLAKTPASLERGVRSFIEERIRDVKDPSTEEEFSQTMRRILGYMVE